MHFKNNTLLLLILCLASLSGYSLFASDAPFQTETVTSNNRPKTALVLSGGGARGAAHVGVLKVLEELKIPIDYVVGTSMGSIVGGLYSSGYAPAEIEDLLRTIDWDKALQDKPPRKILSYKRKKDDQNLLGFEIGFNDGKVVLPEGAIAGQELGFILKSSLHRVSSIKSFNQLPIPFTAVATDIETGELVPVSFGDLSEAIRASMSVPGVFTPVNIDGRKLVDGGLVSNLPVQVARNMGANRVIAVDIGSGLYDEDKLGSILGVSLQMISVLMKQNVDNSIVALEAGDLYMRPDLGGFSSANFKEAYTMIKNGYDEADSMRVRLREFSVSSDEYSHWQKSQRLAEPKQSPTINFIKVVGNERVAAEQIVAHLKLREGEEFNKKRLNVALERVYSIGDFETVSYNLLEESTSSVGLEIKVKEKPWGPNYFRGAVRISDDFDGGGSYNLLVNHRLTQINVLGAEWENTLEIGKRRSFTSEFYQPLLSSGRFFISPQLEIADDVLDIYENNDRVGEYNVDSSALKLDFGWTPQNDSEVRLGLEYAKIKGRLRVGQTSTTLPDVDADIGAFTFLAGLDRQDSPYFPTQGLQATLAVKAFKDALGSDDEYNTVEFETGKFWNRGKGVYGINLTMSSSFDSDLPLYNSFSLGGLGRLSGLNLNQLLGEHSGLANVVYYRPIGEKFPGNVGFTFEAGNVWNENDDIKLDNLIYSGSIFWSLDSVMGALYLGYGITDDGETAFHLNLGQPF